MRYWQEITHSEYRIGRVRPGAWRVVCKNQNNKRAHVTIKTMSSATTTVDQIWQTLNAITDPEIPVVSLVEMGIARDVQIDGDTVIVTITPTFAGCPALHHMREEIFEKLSAIGVKQIEVRTVLNPPWTSEWLSDEVRAKLQNFGLAPPPRLSTQATQPARLDIALSQTVPCPFCGSMDTTMENTFGPTLCQSIHYCRACRQSFQRFKPL